MKVFMYAIRDRAADCFSNPVIFNAPGLAIRGFTDHCNRAEANNEIYAHPDDFDLYELGMYDTQTGMFECGTPQLRCRGKDVAIRETDVN